MDDIWVPACTSFLAWKVQCDIHKRKSILGHRLVVKTIALETVYRVTGYRVNTKTRVDL